MQFFRPEKDEFDCESICSTFSNALNHPTIVSLLLHFVIIE
jgi:hypothetical protein